ncbi:hypothetical protein EJB05_05154, partial [Eragrostis curvula]
MDYTLAALKVFGSQLAGSTEAPSYEGSSAAQMLFGTRYQRAWIQVPKAIHPSFPPPAFSWQGVILSAEYKEGGDGVLLLDDGSCVAELFIAPKEAEGGSFRAGMYVMVIGAYIAAQSKDNYPALKSSKGHASLTAQVHKIVDLSSQPDREAMWHMEVAEAYNLFYLTSLLGSASSP